MDHEYLKKVADGFLAGCDEVGRGPLAGPVVAATVLVNGADSEVISFLADSGITDSKKLSAKKRGLILESLNVDIKHILANKKYTIRSNSVAFDFCIREISPSLIDEINILNASLKAMSDSAIKCIGEREGIILIDGNKIPKEMPEVYNPEAVVKGDSKSIVIGLASIIAKEYRDYLMEKMDQKYPGYGFSGHAGYPTVKHLESVRELGPCPIHRKSFKGVKEHL